MKKNLFRPALNAAHTLGRTDEHPSERDGSSAATNTGVGWVDWSGETSPSARPSGERRLARLTGVARGASRSHVIIGVEFSPIPPGRTLPEKI